MASEEKFLTVTVRTDPLVDWPVTANDCAAIAGAVRRSAPKSTATTAIDRVRFVVLSILISRAAIRCSSRIPRGSMVKMGISE